MQPKKDNTGFNIRKVYKKNYSISKNPEEVPFYSPEIQFEKSHQPLTYTNTKREKQLILDQTVNEAILNSKTYIDLKKAYQENKKKNNQRIDELNQESNVLKSQKLELLQEKEKIRTEKKKIMEAIQELKQKVDKIKSQNEQKRENVQNIYETEAEYFNNLLLSMRFQAEYEHNIDPDQMTYEQLLELQEKIGSVSKGLPEQIINSLQQIQIELGHIQNEEKCTVCYCNFELKETMTELNGCKHQFHFDCLKVWLAKEKICPLCKQQVQIQLKQPVESKKQTSQRDLKEAHNVGWETSGLNSVQKQQPVQIHQGEEIY